MQKKDLLRIKAEKLLQQKGVNAELYQKNLEQLVEELSIYQIELEQQNDEMKIAQEELAAEKKKYSDLFNNAPTGYFILDNEMQIIEVNKTALDMLQKKSVELFNKRFNSLVHPDYQDNLHFCRIKLENSEPVSCDIKVKRNTNSYFFARIIGTAIQNQKKTNNYRITLIDITVEKKLEFKLKEETEIAKRNEKLKSVFLSNMTHEIRTPLNGIMGFSDLLMESDLDAESRINHATVINESGNRLLDLINNLLELSKIESGSIVLYKSTFNLVKLIDDVLLLYQANAEKKNIKLVKKIDENGSLLTNFYGDQIKINQILNNLLNNAIKFSDKGSIILQVDKGSKILTFSIQDNGSGVSKEKLEKLFDRYYQDDSNQQNHAGGTGLGLTICKSLVEILQGSIWAESKVGVGTTFYFTIPIENSPN